MQSSTGYSSNIELEWMKTNMPNKARKITPELLNEFVEWTMTAPMFLTSPEGEAFAKEMRAVIGFAREGLRSWVDANGRGRE
jgi:hypothetical protein